MMTPGEWALLIGLVANAAAVMWTWRCHLDDIKTLNSNLNQIKKQTNGMVAKLEAIARQAGIDEGHAAGIDEGHAAGMKEGRAAEAADEKERKS